MLKKVVFVLIFIFLLFSLLPYAFKTVKGTLEETQLYNNSSFINYEGINVHYRSFTPDTETIKGNIVMIHGFAGSTFSWRYTAEYFAKEGYRVLLIDMPGFGFSDKARKWNYSDTNKSELIKFVCNEIAPGEKWTIAGHSMGGGTAIYAAALHPDFFDKLIVVAGAIRKSANNSIWSKLGKDLLKYPPLQRYADAIFYRYFNNEERFTNLTSSAYGREASREEALGFMIPFTIKNSAAALIVMMAYSKAEKEIELENVKTPTLIVWGEFDNWVPLSEGRLLEEIIANNTFVLIDNAGHCPMETHPEIFNENMANWLSQF